MLHFLTVKAEYAAMNHLICLATNATTIANAMLNRHGVAVKMAVDTEYPYAEATDFTGDFYKFKKMFETTPNGFEFVVV